MKYKRIIVVVIAICLCTCIIPVNALAAEVPIEDSVNKIGETGGYLTGSIKTVNQMEIERLFSSPSGHGFAAEQ